jgi:hypothetical protein
MTHLSETTNPRTHGQGVLNSADRFGEPCMQEKAEELEKILRSRTLKNSESLKALLQYIAARVIEGQDSQVRGYTIAVEVFGRSNFNPSVDSLVRVHAKRLREKLREYYQTEGKSDKVVIIIPKGHYNTVFSYGRREEPALKMDIDAAQSPSIPPTPQTASITEPALLRNALLVVVVVLSIAGAALSFWNIALRRRVAAPRPFAAAEVDYGSVWEPFIKGDRPTLVVLSNPPLFRFSNAADPAAIIKNAVEMTPEQCSWAAQTIKEKMVGVQRPERYKLVFSPREYTGIGEAIGLYRVGELLRSAGTSVAFKQSRTVSVEDLKSNNVVMLGSVSANTWSDKIPVKEDFTYMISAVIRNNNPLPGEQREYRPKFGAQTGELVEDYALITVRPGVTDEKRVMVLAGIESEGTQAAAEFVTSKEYLNVINQRLQQATADGAVPKYYQVLLKVGVDNGIPTTVSVLTIHALKVTRANR